jgi:5'-nucleotidase
MRILLSNDDGYLAPGIRALAAALEHMAEVLVVAPERNRSGASNSLTLDRPLRMHRMGPTVYAVDGTPADCVHLALSELYEIRPEIVVSGINAGENLGEDVLYSGTVAAAMEGCLMGVPGLAISLVDANEYQDYAPAVHVACNLLAQWSRSPDARRWLLNVNVPPVAASDLRGVRVTRLGQRHKNASSIAQRDPYGRPVYWLGPVGAAGLDAGPGTDFHAVENHFVSVTPLQTDLTAYAAMEDLNGWMHEVIEG